MNVNVRANPEKPFHSDPGRSSRARRLTGALLTGAAATLIAALIAGTPAVADEVEGISYTLTPTVEFLRWQDDIGLDDTELYGGRLSFNFGRFAALQGYYMTNSSFDTNLGEIGLENDEGDPFNNQELDLRSYGGDLIFNLSEGSIIPFVKAGGGVMNFRPEGGSDFDRIALNLGGGVRFNIFGRLEAVAYAQDAMLRLDRTRLIPDQEEGVEIPIDGDSDDLRHNLVFGAGVNLFLGGYEGDEYTKLDRAMRDRFSGRPSGASIPLEPFVGRVDFDKDFGLGNQRILGFRTGLDFGRLFGLRGYYWRGMNDDFDDTERIQSWGAEAQYNLSQGSGITPFLLVGGGQIDFMGGFQDSEGRDRTNKTMLIGGAGVNMHLGSRANVNFAVRDYLFNEDADLEDVGDPSDLLHNLTYSLGLNFNIGGNVASKEEIAELGRQRYDRDDNAELRADIQDWRDEFQQWQNQMETEIAQLDTDEETRRQIRAELTSNRLRQMQGDGQMQAGDQDRMMTTRSGDRVVTFPVPEEGEIYVRYGQPGGVQINSEYTTNETRNGGMNRGAGSDMANAQQLRETIRQAIREEMGTDGGQAPSQAGLTTEQQMELLERRIADRMNETIDQRVQQEVSQMQGQPQQDGPQQQEVRIITPTPQQPAEPRMETPRAEPTSRPMEQMESSQRELGEPGSPSGMRAQHLQLYSGFSVNEPEQLMLGGRLDMGPISRTSPLRFVPEVGLGLFNETSFMVAANLRWDIENLVIQDTTYPYLMLGFGILRFSEELENRDQTQGVLNLAYGLSRDFGNWRGFVEHQGIDLFNVNRILVGADLEL